MHAIECSLSVVEGKGIAARLSFVISQPHLSSCRSTEQASRVAQSNLATKLTVDKDSEVDEPHLGKYKLSRIRIFH